MKRTNLHKLSAMLVSNKLVSLFVLCLVSTALSSPTEHVSGRGIASTIWSWITYPFTWWSGSGQEEKPVETTTSVFTHDNNIEIAKHNVTVWCNDQTCTTMKCDKVGCTNVTCNIYDTDLSGVCREYTTKPDEPVAPSAQTTQTTEETKKTTETVTTAEIPSPPANLGVEERPLELEAVLSSTVPINDNGSKNEDAID